jgi:F-type H+-transporting ATPase subunit delta
MKAASRPVARRYSRALLDVTQTTPPKKAEAVPSSEAFAVELRATVELFRSAPDLERAVQDPLIPLPRKKALVEAVFKKANASPLLVRLLTLLVEQGRFDLLPAIEESYRHAWNAVRGVVEAEAVSATELSDPQQEALTKALRQVSGQEVNLRTRRDAKVIGGVLVKMAGKSYDGTVRGRLRAMKTRLAHGV